MENLFLVKTQNSNYYLVNAYDGEDAIRIIAEEFGIDYDELSYEEYPLKYGDYLIFRYV